MVVALAGLADCRSGAFTCEDASDCTDGDRLGTCQLDGHCSFPDDACGSGQRYGAHAGALSGECVPSAGTTGVSDGSTSGEATTDDGPVSLADTSPVDTGTLDDGTTSPITTDPGTSSGPSATESSTGDTSTTGPELALWLQFEEADFAAGLLDESPWDHEVTCAEVCPTPIRGMSGNAALFDGVESCVVVPHGAAFTDLEGVTTSAFVLLEAQPMAADAHMIVGKPVLADDRNSFELFMTDTDIMDMMMRARTAIADDAGFLTLNAPELSPADQWIHVASTWDGATVTLYVDGVAVDSGMYPSMAIDDHDVLVGCDDDADDPDYDNIFVGAIDEVRVYREALTAEQIAALAAGGEP